MKKLITISIELLLGFLNFLKAEQLLGINVSYKSISNYNHEITYKVYTDRYADSLFDPTPLKSLKFKIICRSIHIFIHPNLINTDSIIYGCPNNRKVSYIYTYRQSVNLNSARYSELKSSKVCRIYFCCYYPQRFNGLNNIDPSPYFSYAFINRCHNSSNSSPQLIANNSNLEICCGKYLFYNFGANDPIDKDSLVYSLASPLNNYFSEEPFISDLSSIDQFDVYWPSGYDKSRGGNPGFDPPIGYYLDIKNGTIEAFPTRCNARYSFTTQIIEYKNIGGQYLEVGGILNDFVFKVIPCNENNNPTLSVPNKYAIEAGKELCFTITSEDEQFIPNPPAMPVEPDTIQLTWNKGIANATFTIIEPKARLQSAEFCWTPNINQVSGLPYTFYVYARDNQCPLNGIGSKSYSIVVLKKPQKFVIKFNPHSVNISPNPSVNGQLTITSNNFYFNEVIIFDISGRQLEQWKIENTPEFHQDLSYLASGIYFIKCTNGSEVFNFKWILE